jgi:hypothetical protein
MRRLAPCVPGIPRSASPGCCSMTCGGRLARHATSRARDAHAAIAACCCTLPCIMRKALATEPTAPAGKCSRPRSHSRSATRLAHCTASVCARLWSAPAWRRASRCGSASSSAFHFIRLAQLYRLHITSVPTTPAIMSVIRELSLRCKQCLFRCVRQLKVTALELKHAAECFFFRTRCASLVLPVLCLLLSPLPHAHRCAVFRYVLRPWHMLVAVHLHMYEGLLFDSNSSIRTYCR